MQRGRHWSPFAVCLAHLYYRIADPDPCVSDGSIRRIVAVHYLRAKGPRKKINHAVRTARVEVRGNRTQALRYRLACQLVSRDVPPVPERITHARFPVAVVLVPRTRQ